MTSIQDSQIGPVGKTPSFPRPDTRMKPAMLQQLFERSADTTPEHIAVICEGKEYSYRELENYANRIAHHLLAEGVQAGDRIGILLKRSIETYASIIAVLKLGAAYVPMDTSFPDDRIAYIANDADLSLLISTESISARNAAINCPLMMLDREKAAIAAQPDIRPEISSDHPERELCYIIYTSGSTGRPKGVEVEHRSVVNLIKVVTEVYGIRPDDSVFQGITIAFDFSIEDDSEMKAGSSLGNLSLLMKGETLAEGSNWEGSPAQPMLQVKANLSPECKSEEVAFENRSSQSMAGLRRFAS